MPYNAESSAHQVRVPVGLACPPFRRTTAGAASRSSSHPMVGAPTLHPSACTPTCTPTLQLWEVLCLRAAPHPSSTLSSSFSPWQLYLCGDGCSSPSHPSWGCGFGLATPSSSYVHPPLVTACIPVSTMASPGPPRTGVGQAASGGLQGLLGCSRAQALQEQGSHFQHIEQ